MSSNLHKKTIRSLVTGGAGFIGSHVAKQCQALGHEVVILDNLTGGFEDQIPDGCSFIQGDITNAELIDQLFAEHRFTYVYHLAAYAAEGLSHFIRAYNYHTNLIGSVHLINASIKYKVQCFIFTSSIAVYGKGQLPMSESLTPYPEDPYGISKYAVELDLQAAHHHFGLDYVIFRPHNVYGENQNIGDKYRNVVGIFMNQVMQGQPMTIFGDGLQTRAFSYIDDVAIPIATCVNVPAAYNNTFNIGAGQPYTVNDLALAVAKEFDVPANIQYLEARNEVVHAYSDHSKAQSVFGKATATPLPIGLSKMAAWAKKAGPRKSKTFDQLELTERLPAAWQHQN